MPDERDLCRRSRNGLREWWLLPYPQQQLLARRTCDTLTTHDAGIQMAESPDLALLVHGV